MGQKVNPTIFRLGKINTWKSKYLEKKSTEITLCTNQYLEIKKLIFKYFKRNNLIIQNYKFYYSYNSCYIIINYYHKTFKKLKIKKIKTKKKVKNKLDVVLCKSKLSSSLKNARQLIIQGKVLINNKTTENKSYIVNKGDIIKVNPNKFYLEKLFESLTLSNHNKSFKIFLITNSLNQKIQKIINNKVQKKLLSRTLIKLRKYKQNDFFKEGINLLFRCTTNKETSNLLAQYIATQLPKLKLHKFFLHFIRDSLRLLFKTKNFSNLKGIKIQVKGRFNGAPRARKQIINIGKGVPILTINSNIDYSETTSYNHKKGTFGVKVWIY
jgi:ribosomal protein S4